MKKKPQGRLEGSWLGALAQSRFGVIGSNWLFQGMRYMNVYEVALKLLLDLLIILFFVAFFGWWKSPAMIGVSAIVAHSLNWLLNGHFFVLMRYVHPVPKREEDFERFVQRLRDRASRVSYIDGVAVYGSYCRGQLHEFSDLDVRVMVHPGIPAGVVGAWFCMWERFVAFFAVFPLDIYCCVGTRSLERLRDDEIPVILKDSTGSLAGRYPGIADSDT